MYTCVVTQGGRGGRSGAAHDNEDGRFSVVTERRGRLDQFRYYPVLLLLQDPDTGHRHSRRRQRPRRERTDVGRCRRRAVGGGTTSKTLPGEPIAESRCRCRRNQLGWRVRSARSTFTQRAVSPKVALEPPESSFFHAGRVALRCGAEPCGVRRIVPQYPQSASGCRRKRAFKRRKTTRGAAPHRREPQQHVVARHCTAPQRVRCEQTLRRKCG